MKITDMRINGVKDPLGFRLTPMSLSWKVEDTAAGENPKTARIMITKVITGQRPDMDAAISGDSAGEQSPAGTDRTATGLRSTTRIRGRGE